MWKRSLRFSIELAVLLLIVAIPSNPARASAPQAGTLPDLAAEVLKGGKYQTEWPSNAGLERIRVPILLGQLATLLLYVGIAVVLVLVAIWVVSEFGGGEGDPAAAADGAGASGRGRGGPRGWRDAERLAEQGRFSEATHQLLLAAIWHLGRELEVPPSPASTSRELTRTLPLDRRGREAFEFIVRQVELSLFGGQEVDREAYERCRQRYDELVPQAAA